MEEGFVSVRVETEFAGCHLRFAEGACWLHFGAHGKDGRVFHDSIRQSVTHLESPLGKAQILQSKVHSGLSEVMKTPGRIATHRVRFASLLQCFPVWNHSNKHASSQLLFHTFQAINSCIFSLTLI